MLHSKFNKKTEKMSGILDLLQSDLGKTIISGLANSTNRDVDKTSSALTMGMPVLMKHWKEMQNLLEVLKDY